MSRIALVTSRPFSATNGLVVISMGNSRPSLRRPQSSRVVSASRVAARREKARVILPLAWSNAFRDQQRHAFPLQLPLGIPKEFGGLRVAAEDLAFGVDDYQGIRHRAQQTVQFFLGLSPAVRGAQAARAERQNQHPRQHASGQADHGHPLRPGRHCGLLLGQLCPLCLFQGAERRLDLLHQRVPLVR